MTPDRINGWIDHLGPFMVGEPLAGAAGELGEEHEKNNFEGNDQPRRDNGVAQDEVTAAV